MQPTSSGTRKGGPAHRALVVTMALAVAALTTGVGAGVAGAAGTMTVTPSTGLIDGQTVHVAATGLAPNQTWGMQQCVTGHLIEGCDSSTAVYGPTDANGNFSIDVPVRAILHTQIGTIDCRTNAEPCVLGANTSVVPEGAVSATLAFDPGGPLLPPPVVHATPDTDLIDGQVVAVDGTGFRSTREYIEVRQCISGATQVSQCHSSYSDFQPVGPDGVFHSSVRLRSILATDGGPTVDCRTAAHACELLVGTFYPQLDVVSAAISFDPDGPLLPPPTLVATPSTDLVDGQVVTLSGTGHVSPKPPILPAPPVAPAGWRAPLSSTAAITDDSVPAFEQTIVQCVTTEVFDLYGCNPETWGTAEVDGDGTLTGTTQVWAVFQSFGGETIDCRTSPNACSLYTYGFDPLTSAVASLDFDPHGPLAPPPTVTVTPTTGLVDRQEMRVVGDGFPAHALIQLHQCQSGLTGLDGCDTDLYGVVLADELGHMEVTTQAKQVIGLGPQFVDPYRTTFDCASGPGACRLLFTDHRPVSDWPAVTLTYGSGGATPPPAAPAAIVVVQPQFAG
jgi:hypothetical protein